MKNFIIVPLLLLTFLVSSQENKTIRYKSLDEVSTQIVNNKMNDYEKTRAIFNWVTHNITYDCKLKNKHEKVDAKNKKLKKRNKKRRKPYTNYTAVEIVNRGKGVCSDYSNLFNKLCRLNGIESSIVNGYARNSNKKIGIRFGVNHAWNQVILNDSIYYVDATWSSGYTKDNCKQFYHFPDSAYFLVQESNLSLSHFPSSTTRDSSYLALRENFFKLPKINNGFYSNNINDISPKEGIIRMSKDSTLTITFISDNPLYFYDLQTTKGDNHVAREFSKYNDAYSLKFKPENYGFQYLTIFIHNKAVATYKLFVRR